MIFTVWRIIFFMERKILFPQIDGIMHGGDYNPEQWLDRPDILEEDIRLMKKAGMNCATLGVFSWSVYEPREGEFHFKWLTDIMDKLYANGIYTILATPSGARPAWLDMKYPEAMRVDSRGMRAHHGVRHNHCMSSPIFREKVRTIDTELIKAASAHPGLIMWHISNEFGGECYCPLCVKRFQSYLADKFDNDIEKLNSAWWTTFWSHRYNSFDQIEPPFEGGEYSIMGLNLEWKRFTTWNTTDFMKSEIALLKTATPQIPVTTNFMQMYEGLDYRVMARELDVISWDSYPFLHNDYESLADTMTENSFEHAIMRSMKKDSPFMLMESAPGLVNWHNYNKLKRPGIHRLFPMQAVACGSDTVQYFQWRKGRGSYEQYHGAVIDHLGRSDTRIFKDVAELGALLSSLGELRGSVIKSRAAVIFDWNCWWAVNNMMGLAQSTKKYPETVFRAYRALLALGIDVDVISPDDDFTGYSLIVAPMLYMIDEKMPAGLPISYSPAIPLPQLTLPAMWMTILYVISAVSRVPFLKRSSALSQKKSTRFTRQTAIISTSQAAPLSVITLKSCALTSQTLPDSKSSDVTPMISTPAHLPSRSTNTAAAGLATSVPALMTHLSAGSWNSFLPKPESAITGFRTALNIMRENMKVHALPFT